MTTNIKILITAIVIVILGAAAFFYFTPPVSAPSDEVPGEADMMEEEEVMNGEETTEGDGTIQGDTATRYTLAEVALHASAESCWTVIRGNVYDLTSWIGRHPGGEQAILRLCGTDGTAAFTGQHSGSEPQESTLAGFQIGVLAQ